VGSDRAALEAWRWTLRLLDLGSPAPSKINRPSFLKILHFSLYLWYAESWGPSRRSFVPLGL
jgi:hypothetical protein